MYNATLKNVETGTIEHTTHDPRPTLDSCKKWAHLQSPAGFDFMWDLGKTASVWTKHSTGQRYLLEISRA